MATNKSARTLYGEYEKLVQQREDIEMKLAGLLAPINQQITEIFEQLGKIIPGGQSSRDGVFHHVSKRKSYKYSQIVQQLTARYISKSKLKEVEIIMEEYSTVSEHHEFALGDGAKKKKEK